VDEKIIDAKALGKMVRDARKEQGLTQDDLAGMTGTGRRFISDVENGKETSQIGKVLLILGALGLALYASSKWKK
jgi:HTH-type transcriptional regulator/antitoxin HipB